MKNNEENNKNQKKPLPVPGKKLLVKYADSVLADPVAIKNPLKVEDLPDGRLRVTYQVISHEDNIKAEVIQTLAPGYLYCMEVDEEHIVSVVADNDA